MAAIAANLGSTPVRVVRWIARALSLASIGLLVAFATSGGAWPTALEWALIACFPVGTVAGMALAWRSEIAGGLVTLASLLAFYGIAIAAGGHAPGGPWFVAFASPGLALLGCGIATRRRPPFPEASRSRTAA